MSDLPESTSEIPKRDEAFLRHLDRKIWDRCELDDIFDCWKTVDRALLRYSTTNTLQTMDRSAGPSIERDTVYTRLPPVPEAFKASIIHLLKATKTRQTTLSKTDIRACFKESACTALASSQYRVGGNHEHFAWTEVHYMFTLYGPDLRKDADWDQLFEAQERGELPLVDPLRHSLLSDDTVTYDQK